MYDKIKEDFEEYCQSIGRSTSILSDGRYSDPYVLFAWTFWQAAWERAAEDQAEVMLTFKRRMEGSE